MKKQCLALMALGVLLLPPAAMAQEASSSGWTDVGSVKMKGRLGVLTVKFDTLMVREVQFAYDDTSSFRIGTVTVGYGPKPGRWPQNFVSQDPVKRNSRTIRLPKAVPATRLQFMYSNLIQGLKMNVRVLVR